MQRRWFQFRLRTLLAVVTVAAVGCAWIAREGRIVQERQAVRQWIEEGGGACVTNDLAAGIPAGSGSDEPSIVRSWLGDQTVRTVFLPRKTSDRDMQRIKTCFPGATLIPPGVDDGEMLAE